eukprot:gnl/TRDRNA2_/TRDRNA2_205025_c0_seq1.p1 gnl/TRDRNA2_/TRDRNA2_205025_c0~~gnl/TRDRNA2_/TRDRNA2_205025_c0_seq1.p1  ORF type:complete len:264 (+),score=63.57 gnl/TRDRNA2_/TRDRNA2_205025_c0_seq1:66-857(+)
MERVFLNVSGAGDAHANGVYIANGNTTEEKPIFQHKEQEAWTIQVMSGQWSFCENGAQKYFKPKSCHNMSATDALKLLNGRWNPGLARAPAPTVAVEANKKRGPDIVTAVQERVWKQRKFTDAEVVSDGVRIPVHRATLAAASPVFEAAFSSAMQEGHLAVYEIKESQPAAVEAMLRHVYTGKLEAASEALAPLLDLAVQYELEDLKISVVEEFLNGLTEENVRQRAQALKRHRQNELVDQALMKMLTAIERDPTRKLFLALI